MSVRSLALTQVCWHSRGGQGGMTASKLLAEACFAEGNHVTAFSFYGAERRGAPVASFNRISDREIKLYSAVNAPDYIVVLDPSLTADPDVTADLGDDVTVVINSDDPGVISHDGPQVTVDAIAVALEYDLQTDGTPLVNTPMLGAIARTDLADIDVVTTVIEDAFDETNADAAREAYDRATQRR